MNDLKALRAEAERLAQLLPDPDVNVAGRATLHHGAAGRRRSGRGEQFWQYRRYAQTDAADRVDWRRSARGDELFVRETEMESARTFLFWTDPNQGFQWSSARDYPRKFDRASAVLLALGIKLAQSGERIGSFEPNRRAGIGRAAADRLSVDLFNARVDRPTALKQSVAAVIASDFFEPIEHWQAVLHPLARSSAHGVLFQVLDPAERDFPFEGRTRFSQPGTTNRLTLGRAETLQDEYLAALDKQQKDIRHLATSMGWLVVEHVTDERAELATAKLHGALSQLGLSL